MECLNEISNTLRFQLSQKKARPRRSCLSSSMFKYYMFNCIQLCSTVLSPGFLHTPNLLSTTRRSSNSHKTGSCFRSWHHQGPNPLLKGGALCSSFLSSFSHHLMIILPQKMRACPILEFHLEVHVPSTDNQHQKHSKECFSIHRLEQHLYRS